MKRKLYFLIFYIIGIHAYAQHASYFYSKALKSKDTNPIVADSLIQLCIQQAKREPNFSLLAKSYSLAADIKTELQQSEQAGHYIDESILVASQYELKELQASALIQKGMHSLNKGDFSLAVENALEAVELTIVTKNDSLKAIAFLAIGEMYRQYDHYELAIEYNKKVISLGQKLKNQLFLGKSYNGLGATLGEIGKNQEAIDTLKSGLKLISADNFYSIAKLNSNIGYCYRNLGEFDKAISYHRIALWAKRKANLDHNIGYSLGAIGRAYLGKNMSDSAIYYIQQEYDLAHKYGVLHLISDAAHHLSTAYEAAGKYKQALILLQESVAVGDSIYQIEDEITALKFQRKFEVAQKQKELVELKNKQELQQAENYIYLSITIALLAISVLLVLLFKTKIKQKAEENRRIEAELINSRLTIQKDKNEIKEYSEDLKVKSKSIQSLTSQLEKTNHQLSALQESKVETLQLLSESKILTDEDWSSFKLLFKKVHPDYFNKLNSYGLKFTKGEKLLMALVKLDMQNAEIGHALGISPESVSKSKFRLKKKLDKNNIAKGVEDFVHRL